MSINQLFHHKPEQDGDEAVFVCTVCGKKFARTLREQNMCHACLEAMRDSEIRSEKGSKEVVSAAVKSDWETEDMPKRHATFTLTKSFAPEEMETLCLGHIPQDMEERWFWYVEGNKLYAHRSWTGKCIFIVEFKSDGNHVVTVNRNPKQYKCRSIEEDRNMVSMLLEQWSKTAEANRRV